MTLAPDISRQKIWPWRNYLAPDEAEKVTRSDELISVYDQQREFLLNLRDEVDHDLKSRINLRLADIREERQIIAAKRTVIVNRATHRAKLRSRNLEEMRA